MKTALLIAIYNRKDALSLIFESLKRQTRLPDEILIADDGSRDDTKEVIDQFRKEISIPVKHVWQEDNGFRKASSLNKTIAQTNVDYIIQIDGDCVPGKHFIEDHISNASSGLYLFGARVNTLPGHVDDVLRKRQIDFNPFSKGIKNRTRTMRSKILALLYKPRNTISGKLRGCNMSFWRQDFMAINGYNADIEGWGREDSEMIIRLHNNNLKGKRLRYCGVLVHLYHKGVPRINLENNDRIEKMTKLKKVIRCENGINKHIVK